ncbi:type II secretion system protein [bacterium]|nr:type II secretion system protein [bacterium]
MKNLKTLVESQFPHISRGLGRGGDKKSAFTLAEVLITLGVIGVVASITLPTLIKEYNKHAWVNALKQNYSLLNQGFRKMMADDGVEFIADTEVWRAIGGSSCTGDYDISSAGCKDFYAQLKKYFKIVRIDKGTDAYSGTNGSGESFEATVYKYKYRNSSDKKIYWDNIIHLSNGAMIWDYGFSKYPSVESNCDAIHVAGGHMCGGAGGFYIDINGNRGPNEFGKDIFSFNITERGQLAPVGGNDFAVYSARYNLTQENIDKNKANGPLGGYCDNTSRTSSNGSIPSGVSCTGLLIDQLNWKMDY